MIMPRFPGPPGPELFGFPIEFVYTVLIVFFCFLIYYKTTDMYNLTKYKGIKYFRNTFLFLALAYSLRFIFSLVFFAGITFDFFIPRQIFMPLMMLPVGYFSTMALFYLTYSLIWKRIDEKHFLIFSNILAIVVSIMSFISDFNFLIPMLQLLILISAIIISIVKHDNVKKFSSIRVIYVLLFIFWIINLIRIRPSRFFPIHYRLLFQAISVLVFIFIYYKVHKWVK